MTDAEYQNLAEALLRRIEMQCDEINDAGDVDIDAACSGGVITLAFLQRIEAECDEISDADDVDIEEVRDRSVTTLVPADGPQIVINLQKPLHEIWLASRAGGWHYRWQDGAWRDTRTGEHFHTRLTHEASACAGQPVVFSAA